jgi:hypothetical protein
VKERAGDLKADASWPLARSEREKAADSGRRGCTVAWTCATRASCRVGLASIIAARLQLKGGSFRDLPLTKNACRRFAEFKIA